MAIYKKLLEFQKKNIRVAKDGANPHFKSKYATLNEVLDKVKGPLNELGIVIVQRPGVDIMGGGVGLLTMLVDTEDDSKVEAFIPYVGADTAQKLGSANTYNRRYSLVTLLGLEDEDDDGNEANKPAVKKVLSPYELAVAAIEGCETEEDFVKVAKQIDASVKLTADQKEDLQNLIYESSQE